jgi:glycosyltransferase involved in cell wall biosynthesis
MEEIKGTGKKGKLLIVSDLVVPTGFGRVAHSLIRNWEDHYEIFGIGVNYHGDPHNYKFPIFPANNGVSVYGENRVVDILNSQDFDLVWILNDSWVIDRYLKAIKAGVKKALPKIVVYFPVDSMEHNPEWYSNFDIVSQAVTYTNFGEWVVRDANPILDVKIIPHGVDTEVFYKLLPTKAEAKNKFFAPYGDKVVDMSDSFVVLNANRNQPRKKLDVTMKGFAKFARNKPANVKIYMHCGIVDSSINVETLANRYGIADRLIVSSTKRGVQVVPEWRLNEIYNVADVGINTGMGEGWGLVNVEHAITGAVQLVPNHSACRELFTGCGVLMKTVGDFMFDNSMTVGKLVSSDEVAQKLEYLYRNPEERERLAKLGYDKFTSPEYSWSEIAKMWLELFNDVTSTS